MRSPDQFANWADRQERQPLEGTIADVLDLINEADGLEPLARTELQLGVQKIVERLVAHSPSDAPEIVGALLDSDNPETRKTAAAFAPILSWIGGVANDEAVQLMMDPTTEEGLRYEASFNLNEDWDSGLIDTDYMVGLPFDRRIEKRNDDGEFFYYDFQIDRTGE